MTDKPNTFADIIDLIERDETLSPSKRRDDISALKSLARILSKTPDQVPANTAWLRQRLKQFHPSQGGLSAKRFANIKSSVVGALRRYSAGTKLHQSKGVMSESWQSLYDQIQDRTERYKLSRFFKWMSGLGHGPADVRQEHVTAFKAMLEDETLVKSPRSGISNLVHAWKRCRKTIVGWPDIELVYERERIPWTIPLERFLVSFQEDVDRWCSRLQLDDLFDDDAPSKPLRPTTVKHRRFQIRQMASAVVLSGRDINTILLLADIVEPDAFRTGIQFMMERQNGKSSEALFGLASGIKAIARHHVKLAPDKLEQLKRYCSRLNRTADRSRRKNMERLDQFDDTLNLYRLLHLPSKLTEPRQALNATRRGNLLRFQTAVAIEVLLFCPMRIGNLVTLDMDHHLRWSGKGKALTLHIHIPSSEVKNGAPLYYELVGDSAQLIRRYLNEVQPLLTQNRTSALFPKLNGTPRLPGDFSHQIKRHILAETGLTVNPHLFRSLAVRIYSLINEGDYGTISQVLSDSIGTVMKAYANHDQKASLRRYRQSVIKSRRSALGIDTPAKGKKA